MWFECACGERIHDNSDDHYFKAWIIPDMNWSTFWDDVDDAIENTGPTPKDKQDACIGLRIKRHHTNAVYQCPGCGRMHVQGQGGDLVSFKPEQDGSSTTMFDVGPGSNAERGD